MRDITNFKKHQMKTFLVIFCVFAFFLVLRKMFFPAIRQELRYHSKSKNLFQQNRRLFNANTTMNVALSQINLDRYSPFYGLKPASLYGVPLTEKLSFWNDLQDWKDFFPELITSINRQKEANPLQNSVLFTHKTSITVAKTKFKIGDEFEATLTSLDGTEKSKKFGGDYYRARLLSLPESQPPDGIPCRVIDNYDGTYTVKAPLIFKGLLKLDVTLVHTLESIIEIIKQTDHVATWGLQYQAKLQTNETVTCNTNLSTFHE